MAADNRHDWFVQFEQEFRQSFQHLCRSRGLDLRAIASEDDWKVSLPHPRGGADLSMMLPHNYAMFQPMAVALNAASRLFDMAESASRARVTPR